MPFEYNPQLVTIEGDEEEEDENESFLGSDPFEVSELLGIEPNDAAILTYNEQICPRQLAYLNQRYPEYLGIWPIIAAAGKAIIGAIPKIAKGIKKAVNKKKKKAADKKTAAKVAEEKKAAVIVEQKRIALEKQEKEAEQKKMIFTIGLPVAALLAFMLMKKK